MTVGGNADVHVRLSAELLEKVRATTAAQHVTVSEALRLVLELIADSPGDMLAAMVADPDAVRTEFVQRASKSVRARRAVG